MSQSFSPEQHDSESATPLKRPTSRRRSLLESSILPVALLLTGCRQPQTNNFDFEPSFLDRLGETVGNFVRAFRTVTARRSGSDVKALINIPADRDPLPSEFYPFGISIDNILSASSDHDFWKEYFKITASAINRDQLQVWDSRIQEEIDKRAALLYGDHQYQPGLFGVIPSGQPEYTIHYLLSVPKVRRNGVTVLREATYLKEGNQIIREQLTLRVDSLGRLQPQLSGDNLGISTAQLVRLAGSVLKNTSLGWQEVGGTLVAQETSSLYNRMYRVLPNGRIEVTTFYY
jgi:hypothetical protein